MDLDGVIGLRLAFDTDQTVGYRWIERNSVVDLEPVTEYFQEGRRYRE